METGITVRRRHREREASKEEERRLRRAGRASVRSSAGAPRESRLPSPPSRTRLPAAPLPGLQTPPFTMSSILGVDQLGDALVLDDTLLKIMPRPPRSQESWVEIHRGRYAVEHRGSFSERLLSAVADSHEELQQWAAFHGFGSETCGVDAGERHFDVATTRRVEEFATRELIPFLQSASAGGAEQNELESGNRATVKEQPNKKGRPADVGQHLQSLLREQASLRSFGFYGNSCYALAPFFGTPRGGRFSVQWNRNQYFGVTKVHRFRGIDSLEQFFRDAVFEAFGQSTREAEFVRLYDDGTHAVTRSPAGHFYCCRHIPAYAVEGPDRKLYQFDAAEVGVRIRDTESTRVIEPTNPRVMHPYQHMFVYSGAAGSTICMPRPQSFYVQLQRLPLKEGITRFLEAARMTLCSGLFGKNGSMPYHQIQDSGRPVISPAAARERGLGVYRFYRADGGESYTMRGRRS